MRHRLPLAFLVLVGCVRSQSVPCGDEAGRICAEDHECRVIDEDETVCATGDQIAQCEGAGAMDGDACDGGSCVAGVCLPVVCGDGRVGVGEACDDGNVVGNDGCAGDCRSTEVCGNGFQDPAEQCDDGNALSHDGCDPTCVVEAPHWARWDLGGPLARAGHAMTYDTYRERIVLFGGRNDDRKTWELDAYGGWHSYETAVSPSPRSLFAMAYDPVRRRTVLFGGRQGSVIINRIGSSGRLDDTWEWDGAEWRVMPRSTTQPAPAPRENHAMVYDAERGTVVMIGGVRDLGSGSMTTDEVWEWNGTVWSELDPNHAAPRPPARREHAVAYDPTTASLVVYGGAAAEGPLVDTWRLHSGVWTEVPTSSRPTGVVRGAMAYSAPAGGVVYLSGLVPPSGVGGPERVSREMWRLAGDSWEHVSDDVVARYALAMVAAADGTLTAIGGHTDPGDTRIAVRTIARYSPSDEEWQLVQNVDSPTHIRPAVAFDRAGRRALVVTGQSSIWDLDRSGWHDHGIDQDSNLSGRITAAAYDERRRKLVIWADQLHEGTQDDTATWLFTRDDTVATPVFGNSLAMAYDAARGHTVVVSPVGDTLGAWAWDGGAWTELATTGLRPPARGLAAFAFDRVRGELVLFGGSADSVRNDTWILRDGAWREAMPGGELPSARANASLVWNFERERLMLFGGDTDGSVLADAWEWDGERWTRIAVDGTPAASTSQYAVPAPDGTGLVFVREEPMSFPSLEAWTLRWESVRAEELCGTSDTDGDGLASCADPECWFSCTTTPCRPGTSCP